MEGLSCYERNSLGVVKKRSMVLLVLVLFFFFSSPPSFLGVMMVSSFCPRLFSWNLAFLQMADPLHRSVN